MEDTQAMKIAIVNDSLTAIEALRRTLSQVPGHKVIWIAPNGAEAVDLCRKDTPDLLLMDIFMPVMDGIEATRRIMQTCPCAILLVTATVSTQSVKVFEALGAGAMDVIKTPRLGSHSNEGTDVLLKKIEKLSILTKDFNRQGKGPRALKGADGSKTAWASHLIAIGASTGGPQAIGKVLSCLPRTLPAAVVVIQHMDNGFISGLVDWLAMQTDLPVKLAKEGMQPEEGLVFVAGSQGHLVLTADGTFTYTSGSDKVVYCPSVDLFFHSVAKHWTREATGVLLTGMGRDGASGLLEMKKHGWHTIAQDQKTSAIYGMPKAAAESGAARQILSIHHIGPVLAQRLAARKYGNE